MLPARKFPRALPLSIFRMPPYCPVSSIPIPIFSSREKTRPREGTTRNILKYPLAFRAARATVAARGALEQGFTTLRDLETEGAGYGDVGIKEAIEGGYIPGPRMLVVTRAISTTGGYNLEGYAPELDMPKGAQTDRRSGRGAEGGARAA